MRRFAEFFRMRKFGPDGTGSAAVEFAMLLPLYLLLFMGIVAYGIYFHASHSVQQLSADAARAATAGLDSAERRQLAETFIQRNAGAYLFINPGKLEIVASDADTGQFDVYLSYDAVDLPLWGLFDQLSEPNRIISRRSTIPIGGI